MCAQIADKSRGNSIRTAIRILLALAFTRRGKTIRELSVEIDRSQKTTRRWLLSMEAEQIPFIVDREATEPARYSLPRDWTQHFLKTHHGRFQQLP